MAYLNLISATIVLVVASHGFGQGQPFSPNDPYYYTNSPAGFPGQWHLNRQTSGAVVDANVAAAWQKGWTGEGVHVLVMESGMLQGNQPDLQENYRPELNVYNQFVGVDAHATSVAGVAAGRGGNGIGTTGAAPYATVSSAGIDFFNPKFRIESELAALNFRNDVIGVKNLSYGYDEVEVEFYTVSRGASGPLEEWIASRAAADAAKVIVVRAAMNRNMNANIWGDKNIADSIIVGAVGSNGVRAEYSNFGSNLTVSAPSLGASGTFGITTSDMIGEGGYNASGESEPVPVGPDSFPDLDYTSQFSGTSSATPLVSGILALAKQAQPRLDMRFAKHLLARTSVVVDGNDETYFRRTIDEGLLADRSSMEPYGKWRTNAAGIKFNNHYGFGMIDAAALVDAVQEFTGVTSLQTFATGTIAVNQAIPENGSLSRQFSLTDIGPLEEIEFDFSLTGAFKSGIQMVLTSPSGTSSVLHNATMNPDTSGTAGTRSWSYLSNAFWGESAAGSWTITLTDLPWNQPYEATDSVFWSYFGVRARAGQLIPAENGDYDADGDVDGADFLKWQRTLGSTVNLAADDNDNGAVDTADLAIWREHFGESSIVNFASVPEPTSTSLLFATLALGMVGRLNGYVGAFPSSRAH